MGRPCMMGDPLAGQRFGRWLVVRDLDHTRTITRRAWCRCDCGEERFVIVRYLLDGRSTGCGSCGEVNRN